jgi:uncharacterized protein YaiL (DUF2058 family)
MSTTLRDQLLGLGFKDAPKPAPKPQDRPRQPPHKAKAGQGGKPVPAHGAKHGGNRPAHARPPRTREDIDLAKAYAIRAQKEKDERIEAERLKQEEARQRREAKAKLAAFLVGKSLNAAEAEHVRHFEYGGKIKRIHVTAEQLKALNTGALGVVQQDGRYLLVDADTVAQAEAIFAPAVALKVDPNAPASDDPYSDPQYQVPDDLVW